MLISTLVIIAPIWSVERFIIQDGSGHVNTAFVMTEMLKGNPFFTSLYEFNSPFVPNSSGHWLMVMLLQILSPLIVTKIMMTLTFVIVPLSVVWLRRQVCGTDGLMTSFLIGCVVAFNWFWLLGTFNFMLGFAGFVFTLGLFWRWREEMNFSRSLILCLLIAVIFFSHLVGFLMLTGSLFVIVLFTEAGSRKRALVWTAPVMLTAAVLFILYKTQIGAGGEGFSPAWRSLSEPLSLRSWLSQLIAVDPFVLLSRKTLPFTDLNSSLFALFSPILWAVAGLLLLAVHTLLARSDRQPRRLPFMILGLGCFVVALFGPDDFNLSNGSLLRQRVFMAAIVLAVPLLTLSVGKLKLLGQVCIVVVLVFQTAVLWEFALRSDAETRGFIEAGQQIPDEQRIASTVILEDSPRFHAFPATQMINYLGTGRNIIVVDNYEMGYNLFPIVLRDIESRKFVHGFTGSNVLYMNDPQKDPATDLKYLDFFLVDDSGKIDTMLLYGRNDAVEAVLSKSFESKPYHELGNIRLFRRRK